MRVVECSSCGSKELLANERHAVCAYCRTQFVLEPADIPAKETTISLDADIQRLLQLCRDDPANRRRYASLVLDIDPSNQLAAEQLR